jgi:glycosyltransferase involved in cell wall biosynthesis
MKIAIFYNLPSGGAKRALLEWTKRLSAEHELDVLTLSEADHGYCDLRSFVREYVVYGFTPRPLYTRPFGRLNQLQRWRDLGTLQMLGKEIAGRIDRGGYDVAFAHPCLRSFIPTFMKFAATPVVYYLHEPFGSACKRDIARPYLQTSRLGRLAHKTDPFTLMYQRRLEDIRRRGIRKANRLLANSAFTQAQIRLSYGVEAPVCRYGVNTDDFRPLPNIARESHLLSVGELTPRKGFDFLIESLALIPEDRRPALRLACNWIDPAERGYVETLAAERHVTLEIRHKLNTAQLAIEYNRAALCIYSPVAEPLGLVPLEAMACGTPTIGVAEAGVCETIQDGRTGLLVERDPEQFARAVVKVLDDRPLWQRFAAYGPVYVATDWSWSQSTAEIERHLGESARRGKASGARILTEGADN